MFYFLTFDLLLFIIYYLPKKKIAKLCAATQILKFVALQYLFVYLLFVESVCELGVYKI